MRQQKPPNYAKCSWMAIKENKLICGACGQLGHMRTNKNCLKYENPVGKPNFAGQASRKHIQEKLVLKKIIFSSKTTKSSDKPCIVVIKPPAEAVGRDQSRKKIIIKMPKKEIINLDDGSFDDLSSRRNDTSIAEKDRPRKRVTLEDIPPVYVQASKRRRGGEVMRHNGSSGNINGCEHRRVAPMYTGKPITD